MANKLKTEVGGGSPTFCWQCNNQLQRAPGRGKGLFYYLIVRDKQGFEHRIHGDCHREAVADGCVVVNKSLPVTQEVLGKTCADGGTCHHHCKERCFRRECCTPFSGYAGPWTYEEPKA